MNRRHSKGFALPKHVWQSLPPPLKNLVVLAWHGIPCSFIRIIDSAHVTQGIFPRFSSLPSLSE